jgi:hypothetical protein
VKESIMRILNPVVAALALASLCGIAGADGGLQVNASGRYELGTQGSLQLQATRLDHPPLRLGYATTTDASQLRPLAAALSGDYYFSADIADIADTALPRTGFRASSALLIRQPGVSLSDVAWSARSSASFGVPMHLSLPSLAAAGADASGAYGVSTVPYLGVGYSDYSLKTGWGFWADIGLAVQSPGNVLGMGRVLSGTQGVEDLMRELRMAPMVQLGVNYAF